MTNRFGSWGLQSSSNHKASSAPLEKTCGNFGGKNYFARVYRSKGTPKNKRMFQKLNKSRVNMIDNERHGLDTGELSCFIESQDTTPEHKVDLQLFVYSSFNNSLFMAVKSFNKADMRTNTDE